MHNSLKNLQPQPPHVAVDQKKADAEHAAHIAAMNDRTGERALHKDDKYFDQAAGSQNIPKKLNDGSLTYANVAPVQEEAKDGTHASAAADHEQIDNEIK